MQRRSLLGAAVALPLAAPRIAQGAGGRVLKFIPEGGVAVLDPVWTTATVTRNHGYLVFDTLYGQDASFDVHPQMVAGHVVEADGLLWRLTLREGLRFHDGTPVLARDAVASIRRFAARDAFGRALMDRTAELSAPDDRVIQFRLRTPFPLLPNALGKTGTSMPCIMPERLALTDPNTQVTEMVGSGPFRYLRDEHLSGSRVVYERFEGYVPRADGPATFTAGPKRAELDRIEWHVIPDPGTAAQALLAGEVDWWQQVTPDLLALLRRPGTIKTAVLDPGGGIGILRFNALFPPFDKPAVRRALLGAVDQAEFMTAVAGAERAQWKDGVGVFSPGTPMATDAGMEVLTGPRDPARVAQALRDAGYNGESVVLLAPSNYPDTYPLALVAADMLRKVGMTVDLQSIEWGTLVQRRSSRKPPDQGGWNLFVTYLNGTNNFDPASQLGIRGNGDKAWFGWPDAPRLEALREQWFAAPDLAAQKQACAELQMQFWQDATYLPLGCYYQSSAWRTRMSTPRMGFPQFYDVRLD